MDLALDKAITYRSFNLNSVDQAAAGSSSVTYASGCQVSSANLQDISLVQYREKRPKADGVDVGPVTGSYWWLHLMGTLYGSSRADLFDRAQALRAALAPRNAYLESPQTMGFLPLTFTRGDGQAVRIDLVRPNGVDILWERSKQGGDDAQPTAVPWAAKLLVTGPIVVDAQYLNSFRYLLDRAYADPALVYFGTLRDHVEILEAMAPPGQGVYPWGRVTNISTPSVIIDNLAATPGTFWLQTGTRDFVRVPIPTGATDAFISGVVTPTKGITLNPTRAIADVPALDWAVYAVWVDSISNSTLNSTYGGIQEDDVINPSLRGPDLPTLDRILLASGSYSGGAGVWSGLPWAASASETMPGTSNWLASYAKGWSASLNEDQLAGHTHFALMVKIVAHTEEQAYYSVDNPAPYADYQNQHGNFAKWPVRTPPPSPTDPYGNNVTGGQRGQAVGVRSTYRVGFVVP